MKYRVDPTSRRPRFVTFSDGGRTAIVMIGPSADRSISPSSINTGTITCRFPPSRHRGATSRSSRSTSPRGGSAPNRRRSRICTGGPRIPRATARSSGLTWSGRGTADTLYYRFDLGPLLALPAPIRNRNAGAWPFAFPTWRVSERQDRPRSLVGGTDAPSIGVTEDVTRGFQNGKKEDTVS
jgi:hypothetical protein